MKKTVKALLIFSLALNLIMTGALAFSVYSGYADTKQRAAEAEAERRFAALECKGMISRSLAAFAEKRIAESRAFLKSAQYVCADNDRFCELCGAGDYYFFVNVEGIGEGDYATFSGALDALIEGRTLTEAETEICERISAAYSFSEFCDTSTPHLSFYAEIEEKKAKRIAESALGKNVAITPCESSQFPLRYSFAGGNTYAAVSVQGGKMIELMFYPGEKPTEADEADAIAVMMRFLRNEKLPEMVPADVMLCDGLYFARFVSPKDPSLFVVMAVGGAKGRVCLFDAEVFYRRYGKR